MVRIQQTLLVASLGSALLVQGQGLYTFSATYPSETVTWYIPTELVTGTISAHTQIATIDALTYSETVSDAIITENDGRNLVTRTITGVTLTRQIPSSVVAASLELTSISRTLFSSQFTETLPYETLTAIATSGVQGDLTTFTGPTDNGIAIGTVVEQLSSRSVINTIPGPTVTHLIGQGDQIVLTESGSITTQYDSTSIFIESFSSTLVTRHIATSSLVRLVTLTISDSGSVSGISSATSLAPTPTVTYTQSVTASTTVDSTFVQTSVVFSTLGYPLPTVPPYQTTESSTGYAASPPPSKSGKWSATKPGKCGSKSKATKYPSHPTHSKSGKWPTAKPGKCGSKARATKYPPHPIHSKSEKWPTTKPSKCGSKPQPTKCHRK